MYTLWIWVGGDWRFRGGFTSKLDAEREGREAWNSYTWKVIDP